MCIVVALNSAVIYVIMKDTLLQSNANMLIVNLSVIDLLVAAIEIPLVIIAFCFLLCSRLSIQLFVVCEVLGTLLTSYSLMTLTLIAAERAMVIFRPLKYHRVVTFPKLFIINALQCLLFTAYVLFEFLVGSFAQVEVSNRLTHVIVGTSMVYVTISSVMHMRVYFLGRKHRRQIIAQQMTVSARVRRQTHSVRTVAMILGAMYLTEMPYYVFAIVHSIHSLDIESYFIAYTVSTLSIFSNGALNSVIYCMRNSQIKKGVLNTLRLSSSRVEVL